MQSVRPSPGDMKYLFCFNPACPSQAERVFLLQQQSKLHSPTCSKWILDSSSYIRLTRVIKQSSIQSTDSLQLYTSPIQSLISFFQKEEAYSQKIDHIYAEMRDGVFNYIEASRLGKQAELRLLGKELSVFRQLMIACVQLSGNAELAPPINSRDRRDYTKRLSLEVDALVSRNHFPTAPFKDLNFYDSGQLHSIIQELKKSVAKIGESILKEHSVPGGYEQLSFNDILATQRLLVQSEDSLRQLLGVSEQEMITKRRGSAQVNCRLCEFHWQGDHPRPIFLNHLLDSHLPYLSLCHSHRISRNSVQEIMLDEIKSMMARPGYQQLDVVDLANYKMGKMEIDPQFLVVYFTSGNLKSEEIDHPYCLVDSPQDAAFKIILLLNHVCISLGKQMRILYFKKQYHTLYTSLIGHYRLKNFRIEDKQQINNNNQKQRLFKSKQKLEDIDTF